MTEAEKAFCEKEAAKMGHVDVDARNIMTLKDFKNIQSALRYAGFFAVRQTEKEKSERRRELMRKKDMEGYHREM